MPPESIQAVVKLGKFAASKIIVRQSFALLRQDKEIIWFPILSMISTILITIGLGVIYFFAFLGGIFTKESIEAHKQTAEVIGYVMLFINYVSVMFVANFFESALYVVVNGRFSGNDLTFSDGIKGASNKMWAIFKWSVISATVGIILRIIADKFKLAGRIISYVLGAAWNILTFFSLPALITEDIGVIDAFKESASVIRKKWGETIIINFGVGLVFFLIYLLLIVLLVGLIILSPSVFTMIVGTVLLFVTILVLGTLSSTLSSIFKLAIFMYAKTGVVPQGFSEDVIIGAVGIGK